MNLMTVFFLTALAPISGKITPELSRLMAQTSPEDKITVIVHMNTEYPYERLANLYAAERGAVMRDIAFSSQRDIVEFISTLPSEKSVLGGQYWIFNGFHLQATRDVVEILALRDDVWFICENGVVRLPLEDEGEPRPATAEWNIQKVMADSCWQAGYSGDGVILGFVDTGVMITHEALSGKWLSPYWLDAVNGLATPYDDQGHGTAVAGVACGGDGPGPLANDIGVAYGAKIIPTKAFDSGGSGWYLTIDSCLQYLANLRLSGVALRVLNNSWGGDFTDLHWWSIMLNFKMIGVLPACAAGGSGPGSGTVSVPASYPTVIGSGATDASDNIASFSSRGPAPDQNPWNDSTYWYYPSWDLLKPDVSAPGVNIRTSYNNGGYVNYSGASFAIPHVTGGAALFCDKDSMLTVADLYYLFRAYCDEPSQGAPYPNMNYGWGRINLWRGLQAVTGVEEGETGRSLDPCPFLEVYPSVTRGRLTIAYNLGHRPQAAGISIYDITGRTVKSFTIDPKPLAPCVIWNGDDQAGRPVTTGVYFIKLTTGDEEITKKISVLR
jgi:bacillopeptidase F